MTHKQTLTSRTHVAEQDALHAGALRGEVTRKHGRARFKVTRTDAAGTVCMGTGMKLKGARHVMADLVERERAVYMQHRARGGRVITGMVDTDEDTVAVVMFGTGRVEKFAVFGVRRA